MVGVTALSTSQLFGVAHAVANPKKYIVCFKAGSDEFLAPDGSWHIVVLADPRGGNGPDLIPLNFEVATDEEFQDIIMTQRHFALKKNSYITRVHYIPTEDHETMFYRFVATGVKRDSARGIYSPTSPSSPHKRLSKLT